MRGRRNHSKTERNTKARSKSRSKERNRGRKSRSRLRSLSTSRPRSLSKSRSRPRPKLRHQRWNSPLERKKKLNRRRSFVPKTKRDSSHPRSRSWSRSWSRPRSSSRSKPRPTLPPNHERVRLLTPLLPNRGANTQSFVGDRTRLYIGNLLTHITAEHLRYFFEPFGTITDISVQSRPLKGMNFAFVQYAEKQQAAFAIEEMTGASIDGQLITVEYARPKRINMHGPMNSHGSNVPGGNIPALQNAPIHNPNFRGSLHMWDKNTANRSNGIDQNPNKYITNRKRQFKRDRPINKNRSRSLSRGRTLRERNNISRSISNDREASRYGKSQVVVRDGKREVLLRDSKAIDAVNITNERWRPGSSPLPRASHRSRSRSIRRSPVRSSRKIFRSHSRSRNGRSRSPRRPLSPLGGTLTQKSSRSPRRSHSSRRSRSPLRGRPKSRRFRSGSRSNKRKRLRTRSPSRSHSHSYDNTDSSCQRVQIRNLPPRTIVKDVIRIMSKYGKIADAWIVQEPKGTGFVEFESKTAAQKALRLGGSIYLKDNKISIHPVKAHKEKNAVNNRVHVRNLSYDTTSKDVKRALEGFGKITNAWIINDPKTGKSRGIGFVDFELIKAAERAIKSQVVLINNRRAHLHYARPLEEAKYSNTNISKRLEVRNLTYETSSGDLKKVFTKFGHVIDAWIVKNKKNKSTGIGFVEFASSKAVNNAWKQSQIFVNNRRVHLHLANQNTPKPNRTSMTHRAGFHQRYNKGIMPIYPTFPMNPDGRMMNLGGNIPLGMMAMAPTRLMNQHLPSFLPGQSMKPFTNMPFPRQGFIQPGLPMASPMQPNHLLPHPGILRTAQPSSKRRRYT